MHITAAEIRPLCFSAAPRQRQCVAGLRWWMPAVALVCLLLTVRAGATRPAPLGLHTARLPQLPTATANPPPSIGPAHAPHPLARAASGAVLARDAPLSAPGAAPDMPKSTHNGARTARAAAVLLYCLGFVGAFVWARHPRLVPGGTCAMAAAMGAPSPRRQGQGGARAQPSDRAPPPPSGAVPLLPPRALEGPLEGGEVLQFFRDGHVFVPRMFEPLYISEVLRPALLRAFDANKLAAYRHRLRNSVLRCDTADTMTLAECERALEEAEPGMAPFLQVFNVWQQSQDISALALSQDLGRVAAQLLGVPRVRLYQV